MSKGKAHKRKKSAWIEKKKKNPFLDEDILDCLLILSQISYELYALVLYHIGPDYFLSPSYIHLKRIYGVPSTLRKMQNSWMLHIQKESLKNLFFPKPDVYFEYKTHRKREFKKLPIKSEYTEEKNNKNREINNKKEKDFIEYFTSSGAWREFVQSYKFSFEMDWHKFEEMEQRCRLLTYVKHECHEVKLEVKCMMCAGNEFFYMNKNHKFCSNCFPFIPDFDWKLEREYWNDGSGYG